VFLHGTALTGAVWLPQVAALEDRFTCLTPDLPGHGTAAGTPFNVDDAAQRVRDLIERDVAGNRAILVGLSLGGYVAMTVAARWPERVAGLAIAGATAEPAGLQALGFRALATILDVVPGPALEGVYRAFFRVRFPATITDPVFAGGFWFAGGSVALRDLEGHRFADRLAAYPGPSLLVNGEFDLFFRPTERAFAHVAADPRRVLIRRAAHLTNLEQPAAFSAAIRRFALRVAGLEETT
jgi:pimeloyl-ACP methyl ester carboxylesterase